MTLLSKKLPGIRLIAIKLEIGGDDASETSQPSQPLFAAWCPFHLKRSGACNANLDIVSLLQRERFDDTGGKTDGEAIAPFGNLHDCLLIYIRDNVYHKSRFKSPQMLLEERRRPAPGKFCRRAVMHRLPLLIDEGVLGVIAEQLE